MKEFLRDPLFWIGATIRWFWQEGLLWVGIILGALLAYLVT